MLKEAMSCLWKAEVYLQAIQLHDSVSANKARAEIEAARKHLEAAMKAQKDNQNE